MEVGIDEWPAQMGLRVSKGLDEMLGDLLLSDGLTCSGATWSPGLWSGLDGYKPVSTAIFISQGKPQSLRVKGKKS